MMAWAGRSQLQYTRRMMGMGGTAMQWRTMGCRMMSFCSTPVEKEKETQPWTKWVNVSAAVGTHLCLGSIFAWSILNQPLTRIDGVVAPSPADWALQDISLAFSLVMAGFAWGAVIGNYHDRLGPRLSCLIGASCLLGGFGCASLAIHTHSLPLLYLGGAIWGLANGFSYVPPVTTLLKWFPERKGFASGACIVGFGGGAMLAAPIFSQLIQTFQRAPAYVGEIGSVELISRDGGLFVSDGLGKLSQVIVASAADIHAFGGQALGMSEGVYLLGTGSTGAFETFLTLGTGYFLAMTACALAFRLPSTAPSHSVSADCPSNVNITVDQATRSKQFLLMWTGFGLSITGTYGIISMGKTMLVDVFGAADPALVTAGMTASFVAGMSMANLSGRLFWSNMSDTIAHWMHKDPFVGRKFIFSLMWGSGPFLYLATLWSIHQVAGGQGSIYVPLGVFTLSVFAILSNFGGTAATRPALISDLFGMKNVGPMTARNMSVILPAAYIGPKMSAYLRDLSLHDSILELSSLISDHDFESAFAGSKDQIETLIAQNTVTMSRILELCPPGTMDPTPFVYDQTLLAMACLQTLALVSNSLLTRIHVPKQVEGKKT